MKCLKLILLLLGLAAGTAAAQYHESTYVLGGYTATSTLYWNGIWLADLKQQTVKPLTPTTKIYYPKSTYMDADNRHVVFTARGTTSASYSTFMRSGIFRLDPATLTITTVMANTMALYSPGRLLINQDGDYVFSCMQSSPGNNDCFLKLTRDGRSLTTILDPNIGGDLPAASVGINMDTGNYLFNIGNYWVTYKAVWDVTESGVCTTFAGPLTGLYTFLWDGWDTNLTQNFDNGYLQQQGFKTFNQLKPGPGSRTTLCSLVPPAGFDLRVTSVFDLQSAPKKRILATGYCTHATSVRSPAVLYFDPTPPYAVTAVDCDPQNTTGCKYNYIDGFDFYRGRHLQTIKTAPGQWDLRINCPGFPGKSYVAAISLTGYRPAIPLADGRKIYLIPDAFTVLSLMNLLKPVFDAGPLVLDANGEATGGIDVSRLPRLNVPLWIAVAVIDPAAPGGIAYLPDTYVMRI